MMAWWQHKHFVEYTLSVIFPLGTELDGNVIYDGGKVTESCMTKHRRRINIVRSEERNTPPFNVKLYSATPYYMIANWNSRP